MEITVEVIFWGLIGLAPGPQAADGIYALLAEPAPVHQPGGGHAIPEHIPRVWLLEGTCTGNCERPPDAKQELLKKTMGEATTFPLRWLLDEEHLQLVGAAPGLKPVRGTRRREGDELAKFPRTETESLDLSWIPDLETLASGAGEVSKDCLGLAKDCPISARFHIQGGDLTPCHFLHNEDSELEIFRFKADGHDPVPNVYQAVADAVMVRFKVSGNQIVLQSKTFVDSLNPRAEPKASAVLKPRVAGGTVRLLVGNFPSSSATGHPKHLEALYGLLGQRVSKKPVRNREGGRRFEKGYLGTCEDEIIDFEGRFEGKGDAKNEKSAVKPPVIPHISTECDMAQTAPPAQQ